MFAYLPIYICIVLLLHTLLYYLGKCTTQQIRLSNGLYIYPILLLNKDKLFDVSLNFMGFDGFFFSLHTVITCLRLSLMLLYIQTICYLLHTRKVIKNSLIFFSTNILLNSERKKKLLTTTTREKKQYHFVPSFCRKLSTKIYEQQRKAENQILKNYIIFLRRKK